MRRTNPGDFPVPLIDPRQRRPHSIHIVSYPPGFVPHDLRPSSPNAPKKKSTNREKQKRKKEVKERKREEKERRRTENERSEKQEKRRSLRSLPPGGEKIV
jgi:hypothetical protein